MTFYHDRIVGYKLAAWVLYHHAVVRMLLSSRPRAHDRVTVYVGIAETPHLLCSGGRRMRACSACRAQLADLTGACAGPARCCKRHACSVRCVVHPIFGTRGRGAGAGGGLRGTARREQDARWCSARLSVCRGLQPDSTPLGHMPELAQSSRALFSFVNTQRMQAVLHSRSSSLLAAALHTSQAAPMLPS